MLAPHSSTRSTALCAAVALALALLGCGGRDGDHLQTAPGFETQVSRSQAAAEDARRRADEAAQQARQARAELTRASAPHAETQAAPIASDSAITQNITARLERESSLLGAPVQVHTRQGVVWLRGAVASEQARLNADVIARTTEGVQTVNNRLDVVKR